MMPATPPPSSWSSHQTTNCRPLNISISGLSSAMLVDDLKRTREQRAASSGPGKVHSYCMFIANFGGLMAMPTYLPYCLMYPNIYSTTVPNKDRHHFNVQGGPPWLCTHACICHAVRCSLAMHCLVTPFIIQQPIQRPRLLERVYKPMCTSY